jgi:membrane protease YdiL (CAAX protease family)
MRKLTSGLPVGSVSAPQPWGVGATLGWGLVAWLPAYLAVLAYWHWTDSATGGYLASILAESFFVYVVGIAASTAGWPIRDYVGLSRLCVRDALLGIAAQVALTLTAYIVLFGIAQSARASLDALTQTNAITTFEYAKYVGVILLFWGSNVLFTPISEEILFRGFLYRGLAQSGVGPAGAILATSAVFALVHGDGGMMIWHFSCGSLFGILRWRTGSLTAPIAAHIFGNGLAAFFATFGS